MKHFTRAVLVLALVSGVAVASESNCPEVLETNACGLLAQDGYDRTPAGERAAEQSQIRSRVLGETSNQATLA